MSAKYWYYHDWDNDTRWYVEAYMMSATEFASCVSEEIGVTITASDVSEACRESDIEKFRNLRHI